MSLFALVTLTPIDWAVVGLFVLAILVLGFSARLRSASVLQYLVAGRNLTLTAFVATLVCTWYGGILGIGESVSYYGVGTWLLLGVPYYVFAIVYALAFARKVRASDQLSLPERLESKWGRSAGLVAAGLVFLLAVPAAHVLMVGVLIRELTNWPLSASVAIAVVAGGALLYKGGLLADVRVALLAFVMMYVGFFTIDAYCLIHYPPAQALASISDKNLLTFTGGSPFAVVVSFFVLGAWTLVDPAFHQRVASAETPDSGSRGVLISVGFWALFDLLSISAGLYALALLRPLPAEPLTIFPELGQRVLPAGLKAVFLCGMLGTIVSAMVAYTLVSGATVGREIAGRIFRTASDRTITSWMRLGVVAAGILAAFLALTIDSVVDLWYAWGGCVIGALLIPVTLAYLGRARCGRSAIVASMCCAFAVSFAWLLYAQRTNNTFYEVGWMRVSGTWRLFAGPPPKSLEGADGASYEFSIGTLLPGLVISGAIIGIGELAARRTNHGRQPGK